MLVQLGSKVYGSRRYGTYLFACNRVPYQRQIHQVLEPRQRIQVGQLCDPVLVKDQCSKVGYARGEIGLNVGDAVLRKEEGS